MRYIVAGLAGIGAHCALVYGFDAPIWVGWIAAFGAGLMVAALSDA